MRNDVCPLTEHADGKSHTWRRWTATHFQCWWCGEEREANQVDPQSPAISTDDDQSRTGHPSVSSSPDQAATTTEADDPVDVGVTRIEVIDETGRCFTRWHTRVKLSYQDQGRTLKVFVDPSNPSDTERDRVVGGSVAACVRQVRSAGMAAEDPIAVQGEVGSVSVSAQRSGPTNAQERSAEQELADRNMAAMSLLSFTASASRLQEVETEAREALIERAQLGARHARAVERAETAELRLQEVEAELQAQVELHNSHLVRANEVGRRQGRAEVEAERDALKRRLGVFHPSEPSSSGSVSEVAGEARPDADLLDRAQARLVVCRDEANPFDDAMLDCEVIRDLVAAIKALSMSAAPNTQEQP